MNAPDKTGNGRGVAIISIDVDSLYLYQSLYGGDRQFEPNLVNLTYSLGVKRFAELLSQLSIPATFFVVGQDLTSPAASSTVSQLVKAGHEIANHTFTHPYNLVKLSRDKIEREILMASETIGRITGTKPVGFRAPGYNMSKAVYSILRDTGFLYDSSPLPSPPYYVVKYLMMLWLAARGKKSSSIIGNPLAAFSRTTPHIVNTVQVFPISVSKYLRLPFVGTALTTVHAWLFKRMKEELDRTKYVNLEFHAIDLMSIEQDNVPSALRSQPDMAISLDLKQSRIFDVLDRLRASHRIVTMRELACSFSTGANHEG